MLFSPTRCFPLPCSGSFQLSTHISSTHISIFLVFFPQVHVESDGIPVASSPFLVRVGDPGKVQVAHVRSEELFAERVIKNEVDLAVEGSSDMNYDEFTAKVTSPDGEPVPCVVTKGTDDRVHVKFTPHKAGPYKVKISYTS